MSLRKLVNATQTTLVTATGAQASLAKQWVRFRVVGTTLAFKTWVDGQAEPTTWLRTVTDTSVTTAGRLQLALQPSGSTAGTRAVVLDSVVVSSGAPSTDTSPPSPPTGLVAGPVTDTSATLTWTPSVESRAVDHYQVLRSGGPVVMPVSATYADTGISATT